MFRKTSTSKKGSKEMSGGCVPLFGLPFLVAGLFMSFLYFSGYTKWWRAQRWEEVPCRIDSAELKDGGKSQRATVVYHYRFAGRDYQGDRVSLYSGSDNIGDFQQDAHRELSAHAEGKKDRTFRCYVNPADPSESVIYRTLRWPMQAFLSIFTLTFPAVGAGLVIGGLLGVREMKAESRLRAAHPDERWKWKTAWTGPAISENRGLMEKGLFSYTFWFWLVVGPLLATMVTTRAWEESRLALLVLVLPAIGCIPTWFALRKIRHRMAVGTTSLELKDKPVNPGGILRGTILSSRPLPSSGVAVLTLECGKSTTVKSGDGNSTNTEKVWSHQETTALNAITRDPGGSRLPVGFKLPNAPDSTLDRSDSVTYQWKLDFKVPGTPIHSTFEIPVFNTGKAATDEAATEVFLPEVASGDLPALLAARRIRASFGADGLPQSIVCPPSRYLTTILFLIVFDLFWTGATVFLFASDAPLLFRLVWSVSATAIWLCVIWMALHKRSVTLDPDRLVVSSQFGPIIWKRSYQKRDILGFQHDTNMTSGNQPFYRVRLESVLGKKETLADSITESNTAAALAGLLEKWKTAGA